MPTFHAKLQISLCICRVTQKNFMAGCDAVNAAAYRRMDVLRRRCDRGRPVWDGCRTALTRMPGMRNKRRTQAGQRDMPERAGLDALRAQVRTIEGGGVDFGRAVACLGEPVDAALPWGGLPYRALHEVSGLAATSAVAGFACRFLARGGALVWCRNARVANELGELYG